MEKQIPPPYVYQAVIESVYDGDTVTANIDLGMSIRVKAKCRLIGIDTPELKSKNEAESKTAKLAQERVSNLVLNKQVTMRSFEKPDKYGRLLVKIWTEDGTCVNEVMLKEGYAHTYDGGTKTKWELT